MTDEQILEKARHRVACGTDLPFNIRAILRGDWDAGSLIRNAIKAVTTETMAAMPEEIPE